MDGRVFLGDLGGRFFFWVRSDRSIDRVRLGLKNKNPFFKKTKQKRVDWFYLDDTGFFLFMSR